MVVHLSASCLFYDYIPGVPKRLKRAFNFLPVGDTWAMKVTKVFKMKKKRKLC